MVTPELKWPTTNLTPSPTNLLATDTPCFGSETSSPTDELDLLADDAAGGVDVLDGLLGAVLELRAEGGVRAGDRAGDADLDLRLRRAGERDGRGRAQRRSTAIFFMRLTPLDDSDGRRDPARDGGMRPPSRRNSRRFLRTKSPGFVAARRQAIGFSARQLKQPGALVEPAVLRRHLARAGVAEAERGRRSGRTSASTTIVVQREQRALEQGEVDEAHRRRRGSACRRDALPDRAPGDGDGAAGHPGRPAAHAAR